eukprot:UC1_evm1s2113
MQSLLLLLRSAGRFCAAASSTTTASILPTPLGAISCNFARFKSGSASPSSPPPPPKMFLPFKRWRDSCVATQANADARNSNVDVSRAVSLYKEYTTALRALEAARGRRNKVGAALKALSTSGSGNADPERVSALRAESKALKSQVSDLECSCETLSVQAQEAGTRIPNDTFADTPATEPRLLREVGTQQCKVSVDQVINHADWGEAAGLIDFKSAARATGRSFYYLKGAAALLELGLINYAMSFYAQRGWLPVTCPDLVRTHVAEACGFQPRDASSQMYTLDPRHAAGAGGLCLAGTAEVPLAGLLLGQTLPTTALPLRLVGFGHAFREEAGGPGAAARGLYRVHQFSKVELFAATADQEEVSNALMEEIVELQQTFFASLGLHFKVLEMPATDLGAPAYRKIDVEAWMPGRGDYGEVSSTSNCTDFQARRLNARHNSGAAGESRFLHTINGTGAAIPRLIVALME